MVEKQPARTEEQHRGYAIIAGMNKGKPAAFVYRAAQRARATPFAGDDVAGAVVAARDWIDEQHREASVGRSAPNIGTVAQYVAAFSEKRPNEKELSMLQAHARAGTLSTAELARAAGYPKPSTANLQYGNFGHAIADMLGLDPETRDDGTPNWITVLASGVDDESDRPAQVRWRMHPEVIEALAQAGLARLGR